MVAHLCQSLPVTKEYDVPANINRNDWTSDVDITLRDLVKKLDADIEQGITARSPSLTCQSRNTGEAVDDLIEHCLEQAILAFTTRWIPQILHPSYLVGSAIERIITSSWRSARLDMLRLVNRVSYRSVLALFLFAQTPVPSGISEYEELDGISGSVCMQTALTHIQRLRQRPKSSEYLSRHTGAHSPQP